MNFTKTYVLYSTYRNLKKKLANSVPVQKENKLLPGKIQQGKRKLNIA